MSSKTASQLRDAQGMLLVNQYYDSATDTYKEGGNPGSGGGGGGGGGAVTLTDGADITQGAKADTPATDDTGSWSIAAILKRISGLFNSTIGTKGAGTAAAASQLTGAVYNTTLPALANTQQASLQCDTNANLWARLKGTAGAGADATANVLAYMSGHNQSTGNTALLPIANFVTNVAGTLDRQRGDTTGTFTVGAPAAGTDRSVTATTTAAVLMAANTSRHGFYVVNDAAVDVWINIGGTATATPGTGNIRIPANGGRYESGNFTASAAISIIAASATAAITAREF